MKRREFLTISASLPFLSMPLCADDSDDIYLSLNDWPTLVSLHERLTRLRKYVGYMGFNTISLDETLFYARNYPKIGAFTQNEMDLIERFFHEDPSKYGFFGKRTCESITNVIAQKEIVKIPYTGHFLFKGKAHEDYTKLTKDIGTTLVLTSGVRNVVKQLSLYVAKIHSVGGNMTKASISLAPPAYSYHSVSDFDVGRKGWGHKNFTADFATTDEFLKMKELKYIGIRYTRNNRDGVRFEPWHVEVI
ncbi:MAG: D-alanyl-D-alanine carboxypeptidase family protein [Epsilonproteobacteria bacterium]|nr:D-alanyl-D-alanine carboxypeptidase family protein [Campylobacterota bacterium]